MTRALFLLLLSASSAAVQPVPAQPASELLVPARPTSERPASDRTPPARTASASFDDWLTGFRHGAVAHGLPLAAVDTVLAGVRYEPRVVELDRAQPDDSAWRPSLFAPYLAHHLDAAKTARARAARDRLAPTLETIAARTGVPVGIILGIWGMESDFGSGSTGSFDVPSALASLAYDGRRAALFTRELEAVVQMVAEHRATRGQLRGSWAGAMGQPQFLPSAFLANATDGDGDGRADIWTSRADVAASIATYLQHAGWVRGQGWGMPVRVPDMLDRASIRNTVAPATCVRPMQKHSRWLTVGEWRALGVTSSARWPADDTRATLIEPDGPGTPAYLTFANYRVLLDYNCSNFYALSVALLADAVE